MNLEEWTCAVKIAGSKKSKYLISKIIKEQCLITKKKLYGAYQIDGRKVWDVLIKDDPNCQNVLKEKRINDSIALESKIEEMKYHSFWSDNKYAYGRKRR